MRSLNQVAALALSGALLVGANAPASSAPVTALSAAAKPDVSSGSTIQVRYGGWHGGWHGGGWRGGGWRGGGWGFGALAAGALLGAGIAAATTPYYDYDDPYYYGGAYPYGYVGVGYAPYYGYARPYYARRYYARPYWRHRYNGWGGGPWGPWW
ncbi:hypothetical protein ACQR1I_05745 [Bradyrhizobium sp. HKCCYLS2038]|uniref:hypothetical protein n=1 Tax=unclassified Bradyrhizobium TaxID=2631580 RepID=UPI003EBBD20F